jgi:hypothetical protein
MKPMGVLAIAFLLLLSGCTQPSKGAQWRAAQQDDIREAVFRHQISSHYGRLHMTTTLYFLQIGWGKDPRDPSDQLLKRFAGLQVEVKKLSGCTHSPRGVKDKRTGRPGMILEVADITWRNDSDVEVEGGYFANGLAGSSHTYRVRRVAGKWTVTKDTPKAWS